MSDQEHPFHPYRSSAPPDSSDAFLDPDREMKNARATICKRVAELAEDIDDPAELQRLAYTLWTLERAPPSTGDDEDPDDPDGDNE